MSVSLQKGQKVNLSKESAGLTGVLIGLGWDEAEAGRGLFAQKPQPVDCAASAILLTGGRLAEKSDVVYFGNLSHKTGAVRHMGDNLTGEGDGDDEQILVTLNELPAQYDRIVIVVNIYQAVQRRQHFGMIQNAFIRLLDIQNGRELCRYDLTENYSGMTAMIFGEVYRRDGEWKFNAIGQGTKDTGLGELANRYL